MDSNCQDYTAEILSDLENVLETGTVSVNVFLVEDVYLNDNRLQHLGVLIFHNAHGCKSLLVPQEGSNEPLTFNFPNNGDISASEKEMGQFFYHEEHVAFGYIYMKKKEVMVFTAFLNSNLEISEAFLEGKHLIEFARQLPTKKQPNVSKNSKEFKKFVSSFKSIWPKRYFQDQLKLRSYDRGCKDLREIYSDLGHQKAFYQAYVNFVLAHPAMDTKKGKKFIREIGNIPKFLKETLRYASCLWIYRMVAEYLEMHICCKKGCGGFSFLKCSRCRIAHYCNEDCQNSDFEEKHDYKCNDYKESGRLRGAVPSILQTLVSYTANGYNVPISFDEFTRALMARVYDYFYEVMIKKERDIHRDYATLIFVTQRFHLNHSKEDIKKDINCVGFIGKRRKVEKFDTIYKQMQETFDDAGTIVDGKPFEAKLVSQTAILNMRYLKHTTETPTIILGRDNAHVARQLGLLDIQEQYGVQCPEQVQDQCAEQVECQCECLCPEEQLD